MGLFNDLFLIFMMDWTEAAMTCDGAIIYWNTKKSKDKVQVTDRVYSDSNTPKTKMY